MAEAATIARPYAVAVFRYAKEKKALANWSEMLAFVSAVVADARVSALIDDPKMTAAELEKLFLAIAGDKLDAGAVNLIKLLVEYGRLSVLPQITEIFEGLKAEDEGTQDAEITSPVKLDDTQVKKLVSRLEAKFNSKINAHVVVDPELVGGLKIVVGDTVIDATVHARLQDMAYALKG